MKKYEAPILEVLGSVESLTLTDKIGTTDDGLGVVGLDGSIVPDP